VDWRGERLRRGMGGMVVVADQSSCLYVANGSFLSFCPLNHLDFALLGLFAGILT